MVMRPLGGMWGEGAPQMAGIVSSGYINYLGIYHMKFQQKVILRILHPFRRGILKSSEVCSYIHAAA